MAKKKGAFGGGRSGASAKNEVAKATPPGRGGGAPGAGAGFSKSGDASTIGTGVANQATGAAKKGADNPASKAGMKPVPKKKKKDDASPFGDKK